MHRETNGMMGMAQLMGAMVLVGSSVIVGKFLSASLPVFFVSFLTLLVAAVVLVPVAVKQWAEIRILSRHEWLVLFGQAFFGIILFRVLTLYGLQYTSAVQAGVIMGTTPAAITFLALVILRERPGFSGIMGVVCAMAGMAVLNVSSGEACGSRNILGCVLVVAAVVAEALFTVLRKKVAAEVSATTNTVALVFIALALLLPLGLWEMRSVSDIPDMKTVWVIVYYGLFPTVAAYILWAKGVGQVSSGAAGASTAIIPASSLVMAFLFLGEPVSLEQMVGCFLVIMGIVFSTAYGERKTAVC